MQVELNWLAIIQGVVTQGRHVNPDNGCCKEWTTKYTIHYSADGLNWQTVKEKNVDKVKRERIHINILAFVPILLYIDMVSMYVSMLCKELHV